MNNCFFCVFFWGGGDFTVWHVPLSVAVQMGPSYNFYDCLCHNSYIFIYFLFIFLRANFIFTASWPLHKRQVTIQVKMWNTISIHVYQTNEYPFLRSLIGYSSSGYPLDIYFFANTMDTCASNHLPTDLKWPDEIHLCCWLFSSLVYIEIIIHLYFGE